MGRFQVALRHREAPPPVHGTLSGDASPFAEGRRVEGLAIKGCVCLKRPTLAVENGNDAKYNRLPDVERVHW